jgi:hypothetical protein
VDVGGRNEATAEARAAAACFARLRAAGDREDSVGVAVGEERPGVCVAVGRRLGTRVAVDVAVAVFSGRGVIVGATTTSC